MLLKVEELSLTTAVSLWEPIEPKAFSAIQFHMIHFHIHAHSRYIFFLCGGGSILPRHFEMSKGTLYADDLPRPCK